MIQIFHGDDTKSSREALQQLLSTHSNKNTLKLDNKSANLDNVNLFLNSTSFFIEEKILQIDNFFSIHKSTQDKILPILLNAENNLIVLWQDKQLTALQTKLFPKAEIKDFKAPNILWNTIFAIKPGNANGFTTLYNQMLKSQPYDLFLYLLKNNLRKQLQTSTKLNPEKLKKAYLQLIELDYQNKSGQLAIPKEIALERVIQNMLA